MERIAVIGAGIAGLAAARALHDAGREVIERRLGDRVRGILDFTSRRSGAIAFGVACGYPISPLSPLRRKAVPTGSKPPATS